MTDTTPKFDPIPRLQQIAATIRERGAYTFDAPATAAYYIDCAIKEIERLRKERDEARRMVCEKEETLGCDERGVPRNGSARDHAKRRGWDCFKENTDLALQEIARLRKERDDVRHSYCSLMEAYRGGDGRVTANKLGWGYLFEEDGK